MLPLQAVLFFAYALGATFALSAARQLQAWERRPLPDPDADPDIAVRARAVTANPYFVSTVLFAAVLVVPPGLFLLWQNPSWATMHVAARHRDLWAGFVLLYAGGVVVGAALGFWVSRALALVGAGYWAFLQVVSAYFLMFAVLVHGWDGRGYRRVLTTNRAEFKDWPRDMVANNVSHFLTSGTFLALLFLGGPVVLLMLLTEISWLYEGWRLPGADADRKVPRVVALGIAAFGVHAMPFVGAVYASLLVHAAGWWIGLAVFAATVGPLLLWRRSPVRWLYGLVGIPSGHWRDAGAATARTTAHA
ncbi:hypothetical protein [Yinghuangia seranimata]|uniref:hypothetical protein n=1 Tax=Yinghuangia seranimata TaxID=408067 RepID=UPI00248B25B0|nr:hypothetical protein [Yinghuangia seranimata]MDI2130030.1 hypothetical protein [Yinghuangia seranimata]